MKQHLYHFLIATALMLPMSITANEKQEIINDAKHPVPIYFPSPAPSPAASPSLPAGAATSANQTNGAQKTQVVDAAGTVVGSNIGGYTAVPSATFSRPGDTTAYSSGDLVANSTTAGSVAPMSFIVARTAAGSGLIRRVRLKVSNTSLTNASFRIHFYRASPAASNGDNGAWLTDNAANYLGAFDVTLDKAFTDGATGNGTPNIGSEINFALPSGQTIYGLIEARAAYAPTSAETFTVEVEVLQN